MKEKYKDNMKHQIDENRIPTLHDKPIPPRDKPIWDNPNKKLPIRLPTKVILNQETLVL